MRPLLSLSAFVLCAQLLPAQAIKPGPEDMRHNLETATDNLRLESADTPPFRIEAKFETFDYEGKQDGDGTLVEEWMSPAAKRRVITYRGMTWTQVAHDGAVRSSGDSFEGSFMEEAIVNALLSPGPSAREIKGPTPEYKPLRLSTVTLDCIMMKPLGVSEGANPAEKAPIGYCLSQNPLLLRLVQQRFNLLTTYNRFAKLGSHYLSKEIVISGGAQTRAALHVTSFAAAPSLKDSDFALPAAPDTSTVDVALDSGLVTGSLVTKVPPRYPDTAKQEHISGSVYLHALIDETGKISSLEVLSAPSKDLAKASLDAVRQWKYKPYLLNGKPTKVDTTITVNFSFTH